MTYLAGETGRLQTEGIHIAFRDREIVMRRPTISNPCAVAALMIACGVAYCADAAPLRASRIAILTGAGSSAPERKGADILKARILKRSAVAVETAVENTPDAAKLIETSDVVFVIGSPDGNELSRRLMREFGMRLPSLPDSGKLHPEGFAVKSGESGGKPRVVIAGADERGTIYGVGFALRAMTYDEDALLIPAMDAAEKPAFQMRGGNPHGPGSRARQYGKLRHQTGAEQTETMEDYMLLGTNIFYGDPRSMKAEYGMMCSTGRTANEMQPGSFPITWGADGGLSRQYVCPSVPEARRALLASFEEQFKREPDYDYFTTNSGDEGGCRCPRCMPWGGTYIRLVHEIADILHKYHPNTKVLATNQDLTNECNQAIFDYLNSGDSSWLYAIRYGPGADEMQTYIRGPVNPRWFEYEGFGHFGNYLKYMHHELPRTTNIALYTDITHWMQSQFAVQHPDVVLAAVNDRRSWNARPRHFKKVAQEIFHYAVGDIHYSEGMHDDFNKWLWYRLMWNPHLGADEITREYCRYWLGPKASDDVAEAIFLMEGTLEKPLIDNPGIRRAVKLLRGAKEKISPNLLSTDYRWRVISQKALMDLYLQLALQRGRELMKEAQPILDRAWESGKPETELAEALRVFERELETPEMKAVRAEAVALGEESNRIIGNRDPSPFVVDTLDLNEVGWVRETLKKALASRSRSRMRNAARMIARYDDPGEGGFYDDVGWPMESPHLTNGHTLWGFAPTAGPAKHSHYNFAVSIASPWEQNYRGVSFRYEGLDPDAQYVARVSVGARLDDKELPRIAKGARLALQPAADGKPCGDPFPFPLGKIEQREFDIPREATADGTLELEFQSRSRFMLIPVNASAVSEIWLMRKDKMPWTAGR